MRDLHLVTVSAVLPDADGERLVAKIVLTSVADRTVAASQPRKHDTVIPHLDVPHIRSDPDDPTDDLVARGAGQGHPTV